MDPGMVPGLDRSMHVGVGQGAPLRPARDSRFEARLAAAHHHEDP